MSDYQLEIKQIVDYPRCRIHREFIQSLIADRSIRTNNGCSGLFYYAVLCSYANFRTSYRRIDGITYTVYPGEWVCTLKELAEWLRIRTKRHVLDILEDLQYDHLIEYKLLGRDKLVRYRIKRWKQHNTVLDYPNARWEWTAHNPALLAIQGGIGRIRIYGVEDYEYADVELDRQGNLSCSLVRRMADQQSPDGETPSSSGVTLDPRIWYEQQGRQTLEMLIADLDSRGYKHLNLNEDGSICTALDGADEETVQSSFSSFPPKVYWPQLVKVLEQEGLAATVQTDCVSVAW